MVASLLNVCGSVYALFAAVSSIQWSGAENQGKLALVFIGIPLLLIQILLFLPAILFLSKRLANCGGGFPTQGLRWLALLMPCTTLFAIVVGMSLAK